jgi:hypothetical protein
VGATGAVCLYTRVVVWQTMDGGTAFGDSHSGRLTHFRLVMVGVLNSRRLGLLGRLDHGDKQTPFTP